MDSRQFDSIVVGAGIAGLTAACVAARQNHKVALVTSGPGRFVFGSGCFEAPRLTGQGTEEEMAEAIAFFRDMAESAGCPFEGELSEERFLPTIVGAFAKVVLAPRTLWNAKPDNTSAAIVGIRELSCFDENFMVERLNEQARKLGFVCKYVARQVSLGHISAGPVTTLRLATHFDSDSTFRSELTEALRLAAPEFQRILVPGVLGLNSSAQLIAEFERSLGCSLGELATLPPSVGGLRLFNRVWTYLQQIGVERFRGFSVKKLAIDDCICTELEIESPGHSMILRGETVVLAVGRHTTNLLGSNCVEYDDNFRPLDSSGAVTARNLFVAESGRLDGTGSSGDVMEILNGYRAANRAAPTRSPLTRRGELRPEINKRRIAKTALAPQPFDFLLSNGWDASTFNQPRPSGAALRHAEIAIDNCVKCSVCNAACPVYGVHPQYPGPRHLGPELERLRFEGIATDTPWLEYCLGCHRCDLACPHQVGVSEMIERAKAKHRKPLARGLRDWWFARPGTIGRLTTILPALSNSVLSFKLARFLMSKFMKISPQRAYPAYARPSVRAQPIADCNNVRPRVLFFPGCFIRYNRPELGKKVIELLQRNGFSAEIADTECCGVPAIANGDARLARNLARENLSRIAKQVGAGMSVVTACSSCGYMLKTRFGGLLEDDVELAAAARRIAFQTFDIAELLMKKSDAGTLNINFETTSLRLAYHAPCHQKSQGIGRPWFHLLRQIPGVIVEDIDAGCCGMSGTYGFKQERYAVSMKIGRQLFDRINESRPQIVATECATCQMQIEHGTAFKAIHPVEILLQAYDGRPF